MKSKDSPAGGSVLRSAGVMGIATFLSRIMGLVREQVFAYLFGAGNATDAFQVAFRIPNLLRDLFAEGAMSASLVPTFTEARTREGDRRAWRVAGLVFRVLFIVVTLIATVGMFTAPWLVDLYAGAFHQVPGKFELTVLMTRILFVFFPFVALAAAFMGILNACGVFFMPAFSSALFNISSVIVGVAVVAWMGAGAPWAEGLQPIIGMAVGVVAGGLVQAACQLPALYRQGYRWVRAESGAPSWRHDPYLRKMLWLMVPGTVGLGATQLGVLINTILATSQGPGAVSWLSYAFRLMQFPIGIFGVSLAAATLPQVSKLWIQKDSQGVADALSSSLRNVMAVNLPASAGLAFLGVPIIELIYQYGRFYSEDTRATAWALAMYAVGLTAYSAVKVLVPACYAMGRTRVAVQSSVLSVATTLILNVLLVGPLGYQGLALGVSLAAIVNASYLLLSVSSGLKDSGAQWDWRGLGMGLLKHSVAALFMGIGCALTYRGLDALIPESPFIIDWGRAALPVVRLLKVSVVVGEGIFLLFILAKILRLRETLEIANWFWNRLRRKLQRQEPKQ